MKTMIAALALLSLAAGPVFAANPAVRQLHEGRVSVFAPLSLGTTDTSREGLIHAN
jgi:hypothetical protein